MSNNFSQRIKKPKTIAALISLFLCIGLATAAVFTIFYTRDTATVRTTDVRLGAGPDGAGGSAYPSATVTVASTYDSASVDFSIFPSATATPQPATYYTNLMNISNVGSESHTIKNIRITSLSGASNLGNITIYYYATQTDTPDTGTPIGSASITSGSSAPVTIFDGNQTIAPAATQYIEIVGYAASAATAGSEVSFTVAIQWV